MSAAVEHERFILMADKSRDHIFLAIANNSKLKILLCPPGGGS
jgi:hypothetical protein